MQIVLVGDPRQLPPTVLSRDAEAARLSQSLFERLHKAGVAVHVLALQYRMHPAISRWDDNTHTHTHTHLSTHRDTYAHADVLMR